MMYIKSSFNRQEGFLKILIYVLLSLSGFFLLVNKYPYLAITSFLIMLLLGIIFLFYIKKFTCHHIELAGLLSVIYLYFILSYFISGQSLKNFLSFPFLRYDGNFFFSYLPFFVLAIPYFDYKKVLKIYINIVFLTFSIFSLIGLYSYISNNYMLGMLEETTDRGPIFVAFNNAHNATGSIFSLVCIFSLAFFLGSRGKIRLYYLAVLVLTFGGLLITKSRGSYIGFAAGFIIVLWFYFRSWKKYLITIAAMAGLSITVVYFTGIYRRMPDFFDLLEGTAAVRLYLWEKALYLFSQSPIFGVGFARFNDIGYEYIRLAGIPQVASVFIEPKFDFSSAHAHNSYLQFLAETGILGLGMILLFWLLCYKKLLKGLNETGDRFSKSIFNAGMGGIATLFGLSLTEHYFSSTTIMMCLSMVISLAVGLYWQESKLANINSEITEEKL